MSERGRSKWARERLRLRRNAAPRESEEGDDFESGFLQDSLPGLADRELRRRRWRARLPRRPRRRRRAKASRAPGSRFAGPLAAIKGAGSRLGGGISEAVHFTGGVLSSIGYSLAIAGHYAADNWLALPLAVRRRLAAAVLAATLAALIWFVVLPVAPCWAPAGDRCPPGNDSLALVPEDAAAYLHVNLDPSTDQADAARDLSSQIPALTRLVVGGRDQSGRTTPGVIEGLVGQRLDYAGQILPWSEGELAVALLSTGVSIEPVLMIEIGDRAGADEFAKELTGEGTETDYEGTTIVEGAGTATALTEEFVLVGDLGPIEDVIDVVRGESGSLADSAAAKALFESLPENRLVEAWLSADAAPLLLSDTSARSFDTFVNSEATAGVAASLSIEDGVVDLAVRSELDGEKAKASPSFFAALPGFEPALIETVSDDAFAYLGLGDPEESLAALLDRAQADAPGVVAGFDDLAASLEREGVDLEADLLPLLGGEVALSVEPRSVGAETAAETPGVAAAVPVPYAGLLADGVDREKAAEVLARLQRPLSTVVDPGEGLQTALPSSTEIDGVEAQVLPLSPTVELTYGFVDDRLAIANDPDGIRRLVADHAPLADLDSFQDATEEFPKRPSVLLYLDLAGIVEQLEALGLGSDTAYGAYAQDLRTLEVAALAVAGGETRIDTDLRLIVGEPQDPETTPAPIQPVPESG